MKKNFFLILGIILLVIIIFVVTVIQHKIDLKKQNFFYQFSQIPQNSNPQDSIGISLANLSPIEEKEIQNIVKKTLESQWNYYHDRNENKLSESIKSLYLPESYPMFRQEIENEIQRVSYRYQSFTPEKISKFIKNIEFSKLRKYKDFRDRVGLMAGFAIGGFPDLDIHYFLLRKTGNQWKIEKEFFTRTSPYELPSIENAVIKELKEIPK